MRMSRQRPEPNPARRRRDSRAPQDRGPKAAVGDLDSRLSAGAREILDRELSPTERATFFTYMELLLTWQRIYRLVGSSDRRWIIDELILDSLLFARFLPSRARSVLDLGSGAGIPGIPLRIVRPRVRFTLLEARRRRASFLGAAIRALELENTEVIPLRAEDALGRRPELKGGFDLVVSRCAGEPQKVARLASPFLAAGGRLVVSGPPEPTEANRPGRWVTVCHPSKAQPRTFFVLDSPEA
jgi:16S rRNA (guanine527-N7)-methyltransferase